VGAWLVDELGRLAEESVEVTVATAGGARYTGAVEAVGADVLTLRSPEGDRCWLVPIYAVLVVFRSG
jgi:hypothetical protein